MNYYMIVHLASMVLSLSLLLYLQSGPLGSVRCSKMMCVVMMSLVAFVWAITGCAAAKEYLVRFRRGSMSCSSRFIAYFAILFSGLSIIAWYVMYLRVQSNAKEFFADNMLVPPGLEVSGRAPEDVVANGFDPQGVTNAAPFMLVSEPLHICFGAVNPLRSGSIYVRVVDEVNQIEMRRSDTVKSRWSRHPEESLALLA